MKNYYRILEVEPAATLEQIKAQYRFLLHAWQPDNFPGDDLRAKAEDRVREIHEAYRVLGDPSRRERYDAVLRSSSSAAMPASGSTSQPAQGHPQAQPGQHCESCGIPAETRYVEFYENIGLILIRKHRTIKGNLCRSCIDFYFWNLTGRTMLLGWWGVISFIITPIILLNNIFRFLLTPGMRRPARQIAPGPSPFWLLSTMGGLFLLGFFLLSSIDFFVFARPAYMYSPTAVPSNPIAAPAAFAQISARVDTPTPAVHCVHWSEVSPAMIGETTCVYGDAYRTRTVGDSTFQVLFTDDPSGLFLAAGSNDYEIASGDCVAADGEIQRSAAGVPYIDINDALYKCKPWME